jgi:putative DNA primase/helicase
LHDRAADNWGPLLTVADLAGGDWPRRARAAAVALSMGADTDDGLAAQLLRDVWATFAAQGAESLSSADLLTALHAIEESPWRTVCKGKPLTAEKLARLLAEFGIRSRHRRHGNVYVRADLEPAWTRYCAPESSAPDDSPSDAPNQPFTPSPDDVSPYEIRI